MQAVASTPTAAASGLLPSASSSAEPSHTALASSSTDLSQFLQPSFDASVYVSSLLSAVDSSLEPRNAAASIPKSASGSHLHLPPATSSGRKQGISLSPISPTNPDTSSRKQEQAQEDIDLSLAISRLNLAIEELDRSISTQVTSHAPALLSRTSALSTMQSGVGAIREGISALDAEVANLRRKIHDPFIRAQELQGRMKIYDSAGDLLSRTGKVVGLARRLEVQMEVLFSKKEAAGEKEGDGEDAVVGQVHGGDLSRAALLISELTSLLNSPPASPYEPALTQLKMVQDLLPAIESSKETVVDYMEDMIVRGLRDLSPLMLGSSLQTAFNLGTLPTLVQDLLNDLTEVVKERTAAAFNLDTLSRQLNSPVPTLDTPTNYSAYRRKGTADAGVAADQQRMIWGDVIWKRLESLLVVEMGAVCSKVYLLEKVLKLKTSDSGANFLEAALQVLGDKPSTTFWLTLSQSLQQQIALATEKSAWLAQLLSSGTSAAGEGYTRLLRIVQEFFGKIGVYTDIQYSAAHQSAETVILVKSLGGLEKTYLDRSTGRIAEVLPQATARRAGMGEEEAEGIVRLIANVLDVTRFDPLLSRAAVERCTGLADQFAGRVDSTVAKDAAGRSYNASLVRFSYTLAEGLRSVAAEQDLTQVSTAASAVGSGSSYVSTRLLTSSNLLTSTIRFSIIAPFRTQTETAISTALAKMHAQLSVHSTPKSNPEKGRISIDSSSGASSYATETCDLLWSLRDRTLPLYPPSIAIHLAQSLARTTLESFLLHTAILALPQGGGEADRAKLRLATDMTEVEFALTQLVGDTPSPSASTANGKSWVEEKEGKTLIGAPVDAKKVSGTLKAFRRILFQSLEEMEKDGEKVGRGELPRLILMLHLVARAGAVGSVLAKIGSVKGKGAGAKTEVVSWILQEVSSNGGKEELLLEHIQQNLPNDLDASTSELIQHLLKPSSS